MFLTDRLCEKVKVSVYKVHFHSEYCSLTFKAYKDGVIYSFNPNSPINGSNNGLKNRINYSVLISFISVFLSIYLNLLKNILH